MDKRDKLYAVPFVMAAFGAALVWGTVWYQSECTSFQCWEQQNLYGRTALTSGVIALVTYGLIRCLQKET